MDEAVVLVPEMWAAFPALARVATLAWACAREQRGAAAEALVSSRLVPRRRSQACLSHASFGLDQR